MLDWILYRLLKDQNVYSRAKLVIHNTILRPILLYGQESWVTSKQLDSRIQAADMKDVIRKGKFRWLGHVMRREPLSIIHQVVNYKMKGTRSRGRSTTTWLKAWIAKSGRKDSALNTWCPRICAKTDVPDEQREGGVDRTTPFQTTTI